MEETIESKIDGLRDNVSNLLMDISSKSNVLNSLVTSVGKVIAPLDKEITEIFKAQVLAAKWKVEPNGVIYSTTPIFQIPLYLSIKEHLANTNNVATGVWTALMQNAPLLRRAWINLTPDIGVMLKIYRGEYRFVIQTDKHVHEAAKYLVSLGAEIDSTEYIQKLQDNLDSALEAFNILIPSSSLPLKKKVPDDPNLPTRKRK